jgi:hypothetical protein
LVAPERSAEPVPAKTQKKLVSSAFHWGIKECRIFDEIHENDQGSKSPLKVTGLYMVPGK